MVEIRSKLREKNMTNREISDEINYYFYSHRTVLTGYGSIKAYKIKIVNFDRCPQNTNISVKDSNGIKKSISIINYYKNQYNIDIKDIHQPLLEAESNIKTKNQKLLPSNKKNNNNESDEDNKIYLVPELVYITGIEDDGNQNNRRNRCRNIIDKTKGTPSMKMSAINGIRGLVNSNQHKIIKKNGKEIIEKSPYDLTKEWGINLGDNLTFAGRIIQQPHIFFNHDLIVEPRNGLFRAGNPYKMGIITNDNIFYVFDKNEKYEHRKIFNDLMSKFKSKGFGFSNDFHPNKVLGFGLENTSDWDHIYNSLRNIKVNKDDSFGIIFCSYQLEKFYEKLKNYFMNQLNIPTQHVITKKIDDPKRGKSIQFNVVDQINIKRGGINFYINFHKEGIIKKGEVFLIIGLDSDRKNKKITYSMTSTRSSNLNDFLTQEKTVSDNNQEKNHALRKMFEEAINEINKKSPHCPDYIIIYRQGGNDIRNKILYVSEGINFTEIIKLYREKYKDKNNFNFKNTKLYYICCNLKSDLKFFETENKNVAKAYYNPKSGLIVDDNVTQKNKYEFYLQPQYVNQGTATPCHYQIMYYDKGPNEENDLKIETLEKLSFYLCYYFWTWSGSIRLPYLLKMSNTAMTFYKKILDNGESYYYFKKPTFI
jgi:aubergine-like protein